MIIIICYFLFISTMLSANVPYLRYYDYKFADKLCYLHALVNYDFHPNWHYANEKNLFSDNSIMFSFGSVETQDLQTDLNVNINQKLNSSLIFTYRFHTYETQITQHQFRSGYLGLEMAIYKELAIFLSANPYFDKEDVDLEYGIRVTSQDRHNYFSLGLVMEDFTYDEKNDRGGISDYQPLGAHWVLRYKKSSITLFSEGELSTGFKRFYPDAAKSPEITFHQNENRRAHSKVYFNFRDKSIFLAGYQYYYFEEKMRFYQSVYDYDFFNAFHNIYAEYLYPFSKKMMGRIVTRYVFQESYSRLFKHFNYHRNEFIPAIFLEYNLMKMTWELGVMESAYHWNNRALPNQNSFEKRDFIEKLKLGWTWHFSDRSHIQLSISHVFSVFGFGGANIQMMHFF